MKNSSEIVSKELKETKKSEEQFETIMFLPKHKDLISEGGLRKQGYFKKMIITTRLLQLSQLYSIMNNFLKKQF